MISQVGLAGVVPDAGTVDKDNPWPGLESYREADEEFFHGRLEESDELLRSVLRAQLTVFFGKSGLGKTSLLQAGLFPRLRKQSVVPVYIRLAFPADQASLTAQVKEAISKAAAAMNVEAPAAQEKETLWEYFHHQEADFWDERNQFMLPVLVFDQFEEIFTQGRKDENQEKASDAFLVELGDLIEGRPPARVKEDLDANPTEAGSFSFSRHNYRIVLSLREDFLPELEGLKERIPSLQYNRLRLLPMNGKKAKDVVAHAKDLITPDTAERVVRFVAAEKNPVKPLEDLVIEPALLSVVCQELNNRRKEKEDPRISPDLLEGTQKEILDGFYERSVAGLDPKVRTFIEESLLTTSGYRDSVAWDNALSSAGITPEVIKCLEDRRLIRREERDGRVRLELIHDKLTTVIAASRDRRHQLELQKEIAAKECAKRERRSRQLIFGLGVLAILLTFVLIIGHYHYDSTIKEAKLQEEEWKNRLANQEKESLQQQNKRIIEGLQLRQAVLSNDWGKYEKALRTLNKEKNIKFEAKAKYLYKSYTKKDMYRFEMYPLKESISDDFDKIALITYIMYKQSFSSPFIIAGPKTGFKGTYEGIGCLDEVTALIEYKDPSRALEYAKFDMCKIVKGFPRK